MKTMTVILVMVAIVVAVPLFGAPKSDAPKYDRSTEITLKGTIEQVNDRECPVSGGMGSHLILKLADAKTIEIHLASTKFVAAYDLVFHKGEEIEVTGSKVKLEGVETIYAREIKRGTDTFVFRDKEGNPIW